MWCPSIPFHSIPFRSIDRPTDRSRDRMNESSVATMRPVDDDDSMDANDRSIGRESVDGRARARVRRRTPRSVASSSIQSITAIPIDASWMAFSVTRASHPGLFDAIFLAPRCVSMVAHRSMPIDRSISITFIDHLHRCASMNTSMRASIGVETRTMSTTAAATGAHVASIGSSRAHGTATRGDASVRARVVVVRVVVVVGVERESRRDANGGDARAVRRRGRW